MVAAPREAQEDEASGRASFLSFIESFHSKSFLVHAAHADANWFDPTSAPEFKSPTEATRAFEKEGYSIHMNKGKWINAAQTAVPFFLLSGHFSSSPFSPQLGHFHLLYRPRISALRAPRALKSVISTPSLSVPSTTTALQPRSTTRATSLAASSSTRTRVMRSRCSLSPAFLFVLLCCC